MLLFSINKAMIISLYFILLFSFQQLTNGVEISMPACVDHCGNVKIPYPFGIGSNCYHDESYEIICNNSFRPPKPFLRKFELEVLDINWPGRYSRRDSRSNSSEDIGQTLTVATSPKNLCGANRKVVSNINFRGSPYRYSRWYNVLMVEGCGASVVLKNGTGEVLGGCASLCANVAGNSSGGNNCYGVGCCQAPLWGSSTTLSADKLNGFESYSIDVYSGTLAKSRSCNITGALVQSGSVKKVAGKFSTVLEWKSIYISRPEKHSSFFCNGDFECHCVMGYEGNPYLPRGCQVVEECRKCRHRCFVDLDYKYQCEKNPMKKWAAILGISIGLGLLLSVLGCYRLYRFVKRRKENKRKAEHFRRNGGLLLQQQMSSDVAIAEKTKIYTVTELEKATDNFSESRILGRGGQGTVYKGMLMDGRIVAIKKSTKVDENQVEQFVNEVVILSQINHRNVVKILGCCLETEVPTLVYEFIPNGTLYQHIQSQGEDFHINWKMRLQIAAESAGAVAYLHSSSSAPVYHRDIKSTNILLDEKYRAKVSDFGTSKCITIEQTHVTTAVQGTYGYLDPEYFQSNLFTEKSDVYSFGVVLIELLTGKKPICRTESGEWISLAAEFLSKMEDSRLFYILDPQIVEEGTEDEFTAVAELAIQCLDMNGKQRPTMKEIAVQLDRLRSPHVPNGRESNLKPINYMATEMIHSHSFSSEEDLEPMLTL